MTVVILFHLLISQNSFIHSPIHGYLAYFQVFVIRDNTAFWGTLASIVSLCYLLRCGTDGSVGLCSSTLPGNDKLFTR